MEATSTTYDATTKLGSVTSGVSRFAMSHKPRLSTPLEMPTPAKMRQKSLDSSTPAITQGDVLPMPEDMQNDPPEKYLVVAGNNFAVRDLLKLRGNTSASEKTKDDYSGYLRRFLKYCQDTHKGIVNEKTAIAFLTSLTTIGCKSARSIIALYIEQMHGKDAANFVKIAKGSIKPRKAPHRAWPLEVVNENLHSLYLNPRISRRDRFMWELQFVSGLRQQDLMRIEMQIPRWIKEVEGVPTK
jgi:hypothetical protein